MKLKCNCCDGIYNSIDIHFTGACDNQCRHCIDRKGINIWCSPRPNVDEIEKSICSMAGEVDDVLFLGGEPCLYLEELVSLVRNLRSKTKLKLYVTTAVPITCFLKRKLFVELIELLDGINLSVQHSDESLADAIRGSVSRYERQAFYASLPNKQKIRINLTVMRPYLSDYSSVSSCLRHYDAMGFGSIKLAELQHFSQAFASIEECLGINLQSPYANGCQTEFKMDSVLDGFKTPVILKRSCFLVESSRTATFADGIKMMLNAFTKTENRYAVIYENGRKANQWL